MFNVVLVHPEIPPNTGNIIRLCANTGANLHLVEPMGFPMDDAKLRRAGLDYHEYATVKIHASWQELAAHARAQGGTLWAFTTRATTSLAGVSFSPNDWLIFGSETRGLGDILLGQLPQQVRLPMRPDNRSLNLSNAVAVAVYEAWRQHGYAGSV